MDKSQEKKKARIKFKKIRERELILNEKLIVLQVRKFLDNLLKEKTLEQLIGIYWPIAGEVDLRSLIEYKGISLALPAGDSQGKLTYHKWTKKPLIKDSFGIPAPLSEPPLEACEIQLIMVPALAIDTKGIRLGYGAGSFDQLRSKSDWKGVKALAIVPNACITSYSLPKDYWDIPFDGWINEKETYHIKSLDK